jgi:hypothetical protein
MVDRKNTPASVRDRKFSLTSVLSTVAPTEATSTKSRPRFVNLRPALGIIATRSSSAASGAERSDVIMAALISWETSLNEGTGQNWRTPSEAVESQER